MSITSSIFGGKPKGTITRKIFDKPTSLRDRISTTVSDIETRPQVEAPTKTTPLLQGVGRLGATKHERQRFTPQDKLEQAEQRQADKVKSEERKSSLVGAEERLRGLLEESKRLEESPEVDATRQNELTRDILETRNRITANQPGFATGLKKSFGFDPTEKFGAQEATPERREAKEQAISQAEGQKGFQTGRVVGEVGKQLALYSTVGSALKGTKFFADLGAKLGGGKVAQFTAGQIADLFIDAAIQTPQEVLRKETIEQIGWNRLLDVGINLGIGAGGEFFKSLKKADPQGLEQAIKELPADKARTIQQELGLPADTTAESFLKQQEGLAKEMQVEDYYKQFDKTPQQVTDDFTAWRKQNFGGATGQVSEGDMGALKELYKESTGIDLDVALKESQVEPLLKPQRAEPLLKPQQIEPLLKETPEVAPVARETVEPIGDLAKSFDEKVVRDIPKAPKKSIKELFRKINTQFVDDLGNLKTLEKDVKGSISSAEDSIYKTARLHKGAPEQASEFIRTELEPVIKNYESAGGNYKDLGNYALAKHAEDVNAAGIKSGFSDAEIKATLDKLYTPEIEAARQQLLKVSDKLLDDLKSANMISAEQLTNLKTKWKNYMPLSRSFDDAKVDFSRGLSGSFSNVASPIKKLGGSERKVIDPIESMIKNIYKTTDAIAKNEVGVQLAKLSDLDVNNSFIRQLDAGEKVGRKNVVNVVLDGKKVPFEVEPEIFKTFNNLDKESSNMLIDILSKPASVLRAGATLTPEFAFRNPIRDVQNAFVVSKSGFNPITDFAAGLASTIKKDDLYSQWLKEGGGYGNILSMDRAKHKEVLKKIVKQPVTEKFINVMNPKSFIELLRGMSDLTESATKVGEFRAALRSGATPKEAAFRARDLMDFARAGSSVRPANKVVAFLNANIQGKSKILRAIKENPKSVSAKLITSMALPTVGVYAWNKKQATPEQAQTIKEAPDWLKSTFWLVAIPGTKQVARIPKPFDISAAANGTERFLDYALENDKEAFDDFLGQTIKDQSVPTMISGILPIIEGMSNYSFFRESPIIPLREKGLQRQDQFDVRTSELAKAISQPTGKILGEESNLASPRVIDYILKSSTGGLGSSALNISDWLLDKSGVVDKPEKPAGGVTQLPVLKGFLVNESSTVKSLGEVYDLREKLTQERGSFRHNNPDKQNADYEYNDRLKEVTAVTKEISALSKEIRQISEHKTMTSEEKKSKIDKLIKKRNNISVEAMKKWRGKWKL